MAERAPVMSNTDPLPARNVSITIDGVTHRGTYYVQRSLVRVQSRLGERVAHVGGSPPKSIAMVLLWQLVREARR